MHSTLEASVSTLSKESGTATSATPELLDLTTEASPHTARQVRVHFTQWLQRLGVPATLVCDLSIAVYEALANVAEHAYYPGHPQPLMRLQAQLSGNQLLITVTDHGCWRTPHQSCYRGHGLAIMRCLTTGMDLQPSAHGTVVHLYTRLPSNSRAAKLK
jgi:anti-sigma regulatory factor (Ser/Thr protein kinase)